MKTSEHLSASSINRQPVLLEMKGIEKSFPGVRALAGVDLDLRAGEVLALLGENGAGKSTLIKILGGAHLPDAGGIRLDGKPVLLRTPVDAQRAGISIIYQEFNLVPSLSVSENIYLGRERQKGGFVRRGAERLGAADLLRQLGLRIDPDSLCRDLTVGQQRVVEIAKALSLQARIIVMDEPSAALSLQETDQLFSIIKNLRNRGLGIIYISHRLDEIFQIADRVLVLRDGALVGTRSVPGITREGLIEMMVGRKLETEFPKVPAPVGETLLTIAGLRRGAKVRDVSFSIRRGEVLGLAGLVGAGRTETARLIIGADPSEGGFITLDGRRCSFRSPREAIEAGICLLTEDRKQQGLILSQSVRENFALPNLGRFARLGWIRRWAERRALARHVASLRIKLSGPEQRVETLSGGNQQKVVLAKWLESESKVILFDEPTRGIDVGAKFEIYQLINQLAAAGRAILMISSELPEILGMSDRILVMHAGRISGEITNVAAATQEQIMNLAVA